MVMEKAVRNLSVRFPLQPQNDVYRHRIRISAMTDISTLFQYTLVAFSSLLIIVDPFATAPLFVTMTEGDTAEQRSRMARRASIAAWLTLTAFALGGDALLRLFSITLGAFRIAGGIILFGMALNMLRLRDNRF